MWCCFIWCAAADVLCVVRNSTVAVFLIFSFANGLCIVYSRWPCTFCIDIHEVDGLLSAWARACWLSVCLCVCVFFLPLYVWVVYRCVYCLRDSESRYSCLHCGLLSRARLSLGRRDVIQSLYLFFVNVLHVCFLCLLLSSAVVEND